MITTNTSIYVVQFYKIINFVIFDQKVYIVKNRNMAIKVYLEKGI